MVFEQQKWANPRQYQNTLHQELVDVSEALRSELTAQATGLWTTVSMKRMHTTRPMCALSNTKWKIESPMTDQRCSKSFSPRLQKYKLEQQPRRRLMLNFGKNIASTPIRDFEKGLAGGGWRPTAPEIQQKNVPQNRVLLLIRGPRKKGAEKRFES